MLRQPEKAEAATPHLDASADRQGMVTAGQPECSGRRVEREQPRQIQTLRRTDQPKLLESATPCSSTTLVRLSPCLTGLVPGSQVAHEANGKGHRIVLAPPVGRPASSRRNRREEGSSCFARTHPRYQASAGFPPWIPADSPPQTPRQTRKNANRTHLREGTGPRGRKPQDTESSNGHRFDRTLSFGKAERKRHPLGQTGCFDSSPTRAGVPKSPVQEHNDRMRSLDRRHRIRTDKNHHADVFAQ